MATDGQGAKARKRPANQERYTRHQGTRWGYSVKYTISSIRDVECSWMYAVLIGRECRAFGKKWEETGV